MRQINHRLIRIKNDKIKLRNMKYFILSMQSGLDITFIRRFLWFLKAVSVGANNVYWPSSLNIAPSFDEPRAKRGKIGDSI